ncbi:serine/threonine-protein kinase TTK/MPS1 [Nematocida sp. ERTm5]|nr:serine/threonine-protein kinase TTK/MPS1 [Nematocida sp. ERTm5]
MERLFHIEDILAYIEEQKRGNASATRQLSMYYEATQKNLEANEKTYSLWEGYIHTLERNGYAHTEIREVYKMLKSKFWRFLQFWQGWFNYESRLPIDQSKRAKVLELAHDILQYKECVGKERIIAWIKERSVGLARESNATKSIAYPDTPKSQYTDTVENSIQGMRECAQREKQVFEEYSRSMSGVHAAQESEPILNRGTQYAFRSESRGNPDYSGYINREAVFEYRDAPNLPLTDGLARRGTNENNLYREENGQMQGGAYAYGQSRENARLEYSHERKDKDVGANHSYILDGVPNISMNSEIEMGRGGAVRAMGYPVPLFDQENIFTASGGRVYNPEGPEMYKERSRNDLIAEYNEASEKRKANEQSIDRKKDGNITETGKVFDFKIGTSVVEEKEAQQETAVLTQAAEATASDKYFNLSAAKKITLNGKKLRILRTIGKGGSAKVYQVLSDKNEVFALKKIKISQDTEDSEVYKSYANEISLLKRLKNRHEIVTLKDSYINKDRIAILMEYGDIDLCRFLEIEKARFPGGYRKSNENYTMISIWEQMLRAVKCIHEHRIVHRDLKPGNFLFVSGRLKLIDFGISKEIRNDTTNIIREKQIGTINYMSPEAIIEGKTKMGRNSDIWSLGCILYEMYFGESPFMQFKNLVQRMQKLLDPEYTVKLPEQEDGDNNYARISEEIKRCLVREPKERAKIDFLLKNGICSTQQKEEPRMPENICTFNKTELKEFVSKIMDLRHTATTEEGQERIIEKITSLYFND